MDKLGRKHLLAALHHGKLTVLHHACRTKEDVWLAVEDGLWNALHHCPTVFHDVALLEQVAPGGYSLLYRLLEARVAFYRHLIINNKHVTRRRDVVVAPDALACHHMVAAHVHRLGVERERRRHVEQDARVGNTGSAGKVALLVAHKLHLGIAPGHHHHELLARSLHMFHFHSIVRFHK